MKKIMNLTDEKESVRTKIRIDNAHYYEYFKSKNKKSPESDIERARRCHS